MKTLTLFPYQAEDLETIDYLQGRALISWMQGMGKTIVSLLWAWQNKTARPVVVICPASIKYQWQKEAKDHFGLDFTVLEGGKPGKSIPNTGLYIINYDIVGRTKRSKGWIDWLTALQPKLVIIDEGQRISEPRSIRSRAIKGLCQKVPHVLILSGTPFTSRPIQLWHLVHILKPRLFPSRHEFGLRFCEGQLTHFGWDYSGASRLEELNSILCQSVMVRRRKEDVLTQLPPKQRIVVPVEIENRREYNLALYKFLEWIKLRKPDKLKSAEKAQRLVQLNYLKQLAASLKIKQVKEWISDYLETTGEKLLVFAIHKEMISKLKDLFPQSVVVDGSTTGKKRQGAVDAFNQDPNTKLLFGNIDAAGVGINITSTSTSLFVELAWTPGQHLQAEDRHHGIKRGKGQQNSVSYYLVARDTLEVTLLEIIQKKAEIITNVLDGTHQAPDMDVFSLLTQELLKENSK